MDAVMLEKEVFIDRLDELSSRIRGALTRYINELIANDILPNDMIVQRIELDHGPVKTDKQELQSLWRAFLRYNDGAYVHVSVIVDATLSATGDIKIKTTPDLRRIGIPLKESA
jgi:hypothetical protein